MIKPQKSPVRNDKTSNSFKDEITYCPATNILYIINKLRRFTSCHKIQAKIGGIPDTKQSNKERQRAVESMHLKNQLKFHSILEHGISGRENFKIDRLIYSQSSFLVPLFRARKFEESVVDLKTV